MNTSAIIKQLEKALEKEDEMAIRIEVLLDILKGDSYIQPIQPIQTVQPIQAAQSVQPVKPAQKKKNNVPQKPNMPPFMGGGEQLTYSRPAGT